MEATQNVIDGYQKLASVYENTLRSASMVFPDEISAFFDSLPIGSRILDAGCGPGFEAKLAQDRGYTVTGLDISPEMLIRFKAHVPEAKVVLGDISKLPFENAAFDVVFASFSLVHVNLETGARAIAEFARVLKPNGRLFLGTGVDRGQEEFVSAPVLTEASVPSLYFHYWDRKVLRNLLASSHLKVESWVEKELSPGRPVAALITARLV